MAGALDATERRARRRRLAIILAFVGVLLVGGLVWRPTTEPLWTHRIPVGKVNTATVDLSKDNVIFGLRAIGPKGHRSPAAFPLPPG